MSVVGIKRALSSKRWLEVIWHIIIWLIIFSLPYLIRYNYSDRLRIREPEMGPFLYMDIGTKLVWVIIFYLNAFVLTRIFIYRKKYLVYAIIILVMLLLIAWLHNVTTEHFGGGKRHVLFSVAGARAVKIERFEGRPAKVMGLVEYRMGLLFNLVPFALTIAASIVYRMLKDKAKADIAAQKKQEENLKTELSFLRSQISPHFIFNILNNITALARKKSDELEPTVIKLSSLMRYMLYEANEEKVLLKTEVDYLNSYIELQRQRFDSKVAIHAQLDYAAYGGARIEPMLLIPFVENAFKHGVGHIPYPEINIRLSVDKDRLIFNVRNKYNINEEELKDTASGIGLANVNRRLNLLYGEEHELEIAKVEDRDNIWFNVALQLKLH